MQRLQIQLILRLLLNDAQVRPQGRLGDGLGVVVIVLLTFAKGLTYIAGMMRGVCPSRRSVRLTKCALKQASSPTMLGGNFSNSRSSAKRLNFMRRTTFPCASKPTTWKTSLPMSIPMDKNACAGWPRSLVMVCFS
jgi:hypothetical protein